MKRIDDMHRRVHTSGLGMIYVFFAGLSGLLWLESREAVTGFAHKLVLLGIVLLFFVATWAWLSWEERKLR